MTDEPNSPDVAPHGSEEPVRQDEVHALRDEARLELTGLREGWADRLATFDAADAGGVAGAQRSLLQDAARRFAANRTAMLGLVVIVVFVLLAIFVPIIQDSATATAINYSIKDQGPSWNHLFGTTDQGKDLWVSSWLGARISLSIAFMVALVILVVGVAYGSISGYVGGWLDNAMMRFLDALYGLPYLPFAIILTAVITQHVDDGKPLLYMVPALSVTAWFTSARIMRGQMLSLKQNEYVEGALAAGANGGRVIRKHVLPNTIGVMVVVMFLEVPNAILGEASLSFLGRGVQPPQPSWGVLAQNGYTHVDSTPHLLWVPALLIAATVLAAIAVADGLRDAFDPRSTEN